jgi:hypothetical protein
MDRPVALPRKNDWKLGRTKTRNALSQERKATLGRARSSSPFAPRKDSYSQHTKVRTPFRRSGRRLLGRAGSSSPFAPRKDFCGPFCGFAALREVLEDRKTNTSEQKDAKIAKKSKAGNNFRRFQYVFQRRRKPPPEALPAFFLRDLCDLLFSCFRVFPLVQGIFMLDWNRKTYVLRPGRHSVSVSFRSLRGRSSSTMAWASQSPSKQTNTLEQKDTKIAKKSKNGNDFCRLQYVFQRGFAEVCRHPP